MKMTEEQEKELSNHIDAWQAEAKRLFDVYNEHGPNPWKTFDGRDVPRWHELNTQVQGKWMAVAAATAGWGSLNP